MTDIENKEQLWHRRHGHLSEHNLQKLSKTNMLEHFDYDTNKRIGFFEARACELFGKLNTEFLQILSVFCSRYTVVQEKGVDYCHIKHKPEDVLVVLG